MKRPRKPNPESDSKQNRTRKGGSTRETQEAHSSDQPKALIAEKPKALLTEKPRASSQTNWKQIFSKNLRRLRKHRGYSLELLSRLSGVPTSTLSHLEGGTGNPTLTTWVRLSQALRCTPEDLLVVPALESTSVTYEKMPVFREQIGSGKLVRLLPDPFPEVDVFLLELTGDAPFAGTVQTPGSMRMIFVTRGEIEVAHSGNRVRVTTRNSFLFSGSEVHSYRKLGGQMAEAIVFKFQRPT